MSKFFCLEFTITPLFLTNKMFYKIQNHSVCTLPSMNLMFCDCHDSCKSNTYHKWPKTRTNISLKYYPDVSNNFLFDKKEIINFVMNNEYNNYMICTQTYTRNRFKVSVTKFLSLLREGWTTRPRGTITSSPPTFILAIKESSNQRISRITP